MSNTPELESCLVPGFVPSEKGGEIGLPTCVHCHVANSNSRSEADAIATAKEIETNHVQALPIKADVSSDAQVVAMVEQKERPPGRFDVLANTAGYTKFVPMKDLDGMPEGDWERTFDVIVKGIWLCTKTAVPAMRRAGGGVVLNVTSVAGLK